MNKKFVNGVCGFLMAMGVCSSSFAGVQLSNTRVIINEARNAGSIIAKNSGAAPYVVQTWIEGPGGEMESPFFVTPPLSRLDGGAQMSLVIRKVDGALPLDKESYYWLNVLEIPRVEKGVENTLTIAVRTRVKVFYRPSSIGTLEDVSEVLEWGLVADGSNCQMTVKNNSAFIINFSGVEVNGTKLPLDGTGMLQPFENLSRPLSSCDGNVEVKPSVINDYGGINTLPVISLK